MKKFRLFFALWPSGSEAAQTATAADTLLAETGGRRIAAERLHLTLLFLGSVPAGQLEKARDAGKQVQDTLVGQAFELQLDTAGWWRRPQVTWLAPSSPPSALLMLASSLRTAVLGAGITLESRAFKPHVTLVRKAQAAPDKELAVTLRWQIKGFGLYQSVTHASGPEYSRIEGFSLAAT